MRQRMCSFSASLVAVLVLTVGARANNINTGGQEGLVRTLSAHTLGQTGIHVGAGLKYDLNYDYLAGPNGTEQVLDDKGNPVDRDAPQIFSGNFFLAYGLAEALDISVDFPLYYDWTGWDEDRVGVGDLGLAAKFSWPGSTRKPIVSEAYQIKVTFPTGHENRGYFPRHAYYLEADSSDPGQNPFTAASFGLSPMMMWSFNFDNIGKGVPLRLHFNFGGMATTLSRRSTAVLASLALEWFPLDILTFFAEFGGEARLVHYTKNFRLTHVPKDPLWFTPGARLTLRNGIYMTVAGDIGMSSLKTKYRTDWDRNGYRYSTAPTPRYGVQVSVGWTGIAKEPDTDGDGIIDKKDTCPEQTEDSDGFQDEDGCPDPDNDGDGVADSNDECPDEAAECDGCPVIDADGDGIDDDTDTCPEQAEDNDGFQDKDGCPDPDNDADGVPDAKDQCPDKAEDQDGYEDHDGCPDVDNDNDDVPDRTDKCPNHKGIPENNGCPKAKEIKRGGLILKGVNFRSGKAALLPSSYSVLNEVVASLKEWPKAKIEVQGYTDSRGSSQANQLLSERRAEAVARYIAGKGIAPSRVRAVGLGESRPVADNSSAEGRAMNRRVELHRVD